MDKSFREEMQRKLEEAIRTEKDNAQQQEKTTPDITGAACPAKKAPSPAARGELLQKMKPLPPKKPSRQPPAKQKRRIVLPIVTVVVALVAALAVLALCHTARVECGEVGKIGPGSIVLYWREEPAYGQAVLTGDNQVGRIAGLPGDLVFVDGKTGRLFVNSHLVEEENACLGDSGMVMNEPLLISSGSVFIIGDNRKETIGQMLPQDEIKGRVVSFFTAKEQLTDIQKGAKP